MKLPYFCACAASRAGGYCPCTCLATGSSRRGGAAGRLASGLLLLTLLGGAAHAQRPDLRLGLVASGGTDADSAAVYFEPGATPGFDIDFDAGKLLNPSGLNLASLTVDGQQLATNGLPPSLLGNPLAVSLYVTVPAYGTYTLQVGKLANFAPTAVYLTDALLQTTALLAPGTAYAFELTAANTSGTYATSTRFALQFVPSAAPLPVTLTRFTAEVRPRGMQLAWGTATEWHSAYFAVERSVDGQAFAELGRVAAAGSSGQPRDYALLDAQPLAGVGYYRLRQVDLDGSLSYSPVRVVAPAPQGLTLFPNPAHAPVTLLDAGPQGLVQILDGRGRLVAITTADATGRAHVVLPAGLAGGSTWCRRARK
ncbi:hypothetical protein [Hymenobacter bucti]|uniref:T9SS type A sorting domain-containing protein n=1 Tax=Hymenobacter bucti TaxID=1844114 RepID=A0ABW4R265_9BACT